MKKQIKKVIAVVLSLATVMLIGLPAYAAEEETKSENFFSDIESGMSDIISGENGLSLENIYKTASEEVSEAPSEENPETPTEEAPETPKEENPETPTEEAPETPKEENPENPTEENPETPNEENPETPNEENPGTPNEETPETSSEETPEASTEENPETFFSDIEKGITEIVSGKNGLSLENIFKTVPEQVSETPNEEDEFEYDFYEEYEPSYFERVVAIAWSGASLLEEGLTYVALSPICLLSMLNPLTYIFVFPAIVFPFMLPAGLLTSLAGIVEIVGSPIIAVFYR